MKQAVNQFDNAGQVCLAGTRLLVEDVIHDEFLARFAEASAAIRQGDPRDEATDIGPLITREHFQRVDGFVQRAKAEGIEVAFGGGPNEELGGLYYRPTVFLEPPSGSEILQHEVFGPVLTLQRFSGEEDGIAKANDTTYGLSAIVYRATRRRRIGFPRRSSRGRCGSTASTCATSGCRSGARGTAGSAARAVSGASTSTRT